METKVCKDCGLERPLDNFYKNNQQKDGLTVYCRDCLKAKLQSNPKAQQNLRKAQLKKLYNITLEDYEEIAEKQGHKCGICRSKDNDGRRKYLSVDHDHQTGKVRGLLCHDCNLGLGKFKDNIILLNLATIYLNSHSTQGE